MKLFRKFSLSSFAVSLLALIQAGFPTSSLAQTNATFPVVTIRATDPLAKWSGDTGAVTLFRSGDIRSNLNVWCGVSGTASNGVDFQTLGMIVQFPAGAASNTVVVKPINNGQTDTRTVKFNLRGSPLASPINYAIGCPDTATVFITPDGVTDLPPAVSIESPRDGSIFTAPVDVRLTAFANDADGSVVSVEFFANSTSLGVISNGVIVDPTAGACIPPGTRGFLLTWSNAPPGTNILLTAKATDNGGASTISDPVSITIRGGSGTNLPPVVRISSPPNGAVFRGPVDVPIYAYANDFDGYVASVEFFADATSLGLGQQVRSTAGTNTYPGAGVWFLVWSNAPPGTNIALTAKATDNGGASTTSDPVRISILPPLPPPTNRPPIISIFAPDPIAIEGTNCWPWVGLAGAPTWGSWTNPTAVCRFFTNCGPKNATFAVRRYGDTNTDVLVAYDVGGTATNGVDYVPLSGSVLIPAGQRGALITVVPIDDGPPDLTSTVILRLRPNTNTPPDYLLGYPRSAGAIILDKGPRPTSGMMADQTFHLATTGPDGAWFHIESSTDMTHWTSICTNQVVNGAIDFVDPDSAANPASYYRAVPESGPPPQ
jgi:hypothetical protein